MTEINIKNQLQEDMKTALKARDQKRLDIIRLMIAAIKQKQIDSQIDLDNAGVITVLDKMIKQRQDSHEQYQKANRQDLARQEAYEIEVIETYMPKKLSEAELDALIHAAIKESAATSIKDMGKVMEKIKAKVQGRADMRQVSEKIKAALQ